MPMYPKREPFFAHRFVRLLYKSCAILDIGANAAHLVVAIAHTEDAARYSGPIRYWNEQLMNMLCLSRKQLNTARKKAIEYGWLHYERKSNRDVGRYWVTIPERAMGLDDSLIEPMVPSGVQERNDSGPKNDVIGPSGVQENEVIGPSGVRQRNNKGTIEGLYSNPGPYPNPKARAHHQKAHQNDFDHFWSVVHHKVGKGHARKAFQQAVKNGASPEVIIQAMVEFAASPEARPRDRTPIHPSTWLNAERWDDDRETWHVTKDTPRKPRVATAEDLADWSPTG